MPSSCLKLEGPTIHLTLNMLKTCYCRLSCACKKMMWPPFMIKEVSPAPPPPLPSPSPKNFKFWVAKLESQHWDWLQFWLICKSTLWFTSVWELHYILSLSLCYCILLQVCKPIISLYPPPPPPPHPLALTDYLESTLPQINYLFADVADYCIVIPMLTGREPS